MAASDSLIHPKKNMAFRVSFPIYDADGDLVSGASSLDSEVSKDGGAYADCTNEATEIGSSGTYYLDLTSGEMNADQVLVKTTSTEGKTVVLVFNLGGTIDTTTTAMAAGVITASAIATGAIDADAIADNAIDAGAIAADAITAAKIANGAIDAATFAADVDAEILSYLVDDATRIDASALNTLSGHDPGETIMGATDLGTGSGLTSLATAANLATVAGYLDTEIAAILADTNELQTDWANGGRLDNILDARASQTSVDDVPTNAELATALAGADDATLAAIAALNNLSAAQVNAEVDTALADIKLDHLIHLAVDTDYNTTVHQNSVVGYLGSTGNTYDRSTDSQEAIRNRGDAAWVTATGFSTHSAADVWAVATRVLTAGTNIQLPSNGLANVTAWTVAITGNLTGNVSGSVGSVVGAVGSVTGNVGGNVTGTIGGLTTSAKAEVESEVNDALVAQRLDELLNADSDIDGAAPPTVGSVFHELLSKTAGSFTFDQTTDSLEALRDRGDAAWITATGFSTHSASDVWAVGTRILTAGTNIALAKGTGVTGFNDLSAAQVNAEVDTAIADVGLTVTVTGRIDAAISSRGTGTALDAAGVRTAVGLASANLDTQIGTLATQASVNTIDDLIDTEVAAIKAKTDQLTFTTSNKVDAKLTSDGLDNIAVTAPSGVATSFREMVVQLWRRFFKKTVRNATDGNIKTYADNGSTVVTTQAYTSASGVDTIDGAS